MLLCTCYMPHTNVLSRPCCCLRAAGAGSGEVDLDDPDFWTKHNFGFREPLMDEARYLGKRQRKAVDYTSKGQEVVWGAGSDSDASVDGGEAEDDGQAALPKHWPYSEVREFANALASFGWLHLRDLATSIKSPRGESDLRATAAGIIMLCMWNEQDKAEAKKVAQDAKKAAADADGGGDGDGDGEAANAAKAAAAAAADPDAPRIRNGADMIQVRLASLAAAHRRWQSEACPLARRVLNYVRAAVGLPPLPQKPAKLVAAAETSSKVVTGASDEAAHPKVAGVSEAESEAYWRHRLPRHVLSQKVVDMIWKRNWGASKLMVSTLSHAHHLCWA